MVANDWQLQMSLLIRRDGPVEYLTLNRPQVRNAFNPEVVAALRSWADGLRDGIPVRAAVLAGAGPVFCAGGDLDWMAKVAGFSHEENLADARSMAAMFAAIDRVGVPVVGRVHGAAMGGGVGLAAVCDIVIAAEDAVFALTEVRLGLVPSVIAPFVIAKIGRSAARELFLTGERFTARRALEIGLVHEVVPADRLDEAVGRRVRAILSSAPGAVAAAKALVERVASLPLADAAPLTVEAIAARRESEEGREGMRAFLDKRSPPWEGR
jgi:methylglutaconyl-CoA hydratase